MTTADLYRQIQKKRTLLCVGLDPDVSRFPEGVTSIFDFNRAVIEATAPYCVAYKPNLAFYERHGLEGLRALAQTVDYLRARFPEQFLIADAKRGDIGHTAEMYARAFFETLDFDAVTISPYMGIEAVQPFLAYKGRFAVVVALSSNPGAADFQFARQDGKPLYRTVMEKCMQISTPDNLMFVVGATRASRLAEIRRFCPDRFLLVPGVGAQGGSAAEVIRYGANRTGGLLINSSRAILYASSGRDFAEAAARAAAATAPFPCEG